MQPRRRRPAPTTAARYRARDFHDPIQLQVAY